MIFGDENAFPNGSGVDTLNASAKGSCSNPSIVFSFVLEKETFFLFWILSSSFVFSYL